MMSLSRLATVIFVAFSLIVPLCRAEGSYQYSKYTACDDSAITVTDLSILCDSPGAYYYGSNKYRNSASCQGGDKVKVNIQFDLNQDLEADAYVTIEAKGYGTVSSKTIYAAEPLCSIPNLKAVDKQNCGSAGNYIIQERFYWGEKDDEYEYSFSPKLVVGFASNVNKKVYDLGGANTNACSGDIFTNWTKSIQKSAANTIKTFLATFGILLGSILGICSLGWCLMRQANARPKEFIMEEPPDENEYYKMAMMEHQMRNWS